MGPQLYLHSESECQTGHPSAGSRNHFPVGQRPEKDEDLQQGAPAGLRAQTLPALSQQLGPGGLRPGSYSPPSLLPRHPISKASWTQKAGSSQPHSHKTRGTVTTHSAGPRPPSLPAAWAAGSRLPRSQAAPSSAEKQGSQTGAGVGAPGPCGLGGRELETQAGTGAEGGQRTMAG